MNRQRNETKIKHATKKSNSERNNDLTRKHTKATKRKHSKKTTNNEWTKKHEHKHEAKNTPTKETKTFLVGWWGWVRGNCLASVDSPIHFLKGVGVGIKVAAPACA